MRLIEASPSAISSRQAAVSARLDLPASSGTGFSLPLLPGPRPLSGGVPTFLAQHVAQELMAGAPAAPRWQARDSAYRLAAAPLDPALFALDA